MKAKIFAASRSGNLPKAGFAYGLPLLLMSSAASALINISSPSASCGYLAVKPATDARGDKTLAASLRAYGAQALKSSAVSRAWHGRLACGAGIR